MTKPVVLDPSVVLAWLLHDEQEPLADMAIERLPEGSTWVFSEGVAAFAPGLGNLSKRAGRLLDIGIFEVRNGLLMGERRGRLSREQCNRCVGSLQTIPVQTDNETDLDAALGLAREHGLTFYDSLYLELARRRSAGIATLDQALLRAARTEGITNP